MKIDMAEYEEFRKTLPEDIQNEVFKWIGSYYDVARALYLIKREKLEVNSIKVMDWAKAFGMAGPLQDESDKVMYINIMTGVKDSEAMKENIKPEGYPIIIVEHEFGKGKKKEMTNLVIDGNKRLRKAFLTNMEKIGAYYLPVKLAKLVKDC